MDKTGTITKGKPELGNIVNYSDMSDADILSLVASLESKSEHPIAHAILIASREQSLGPQSVELFQIIKGKGVTGIISGIEYFAGNSKLMDDISIAFDKEAIDTETKQGKTPVILATRQKLLGIFFVADSIKPESADAIKALHKLGIKTIMLTGDNKNTGRFIADQVGIDEVVAEVMPQDKLNIIRKLQSE